MVQSLEVIRVQWFRRFRDGVSDVVGNCRRSVTPNAHLQIMIY
jgi:hypothetical protein